MWGVEAVLNDPRLEKMSFSSAVLVMMTLKRKVTNSTKDSLLLFYSQHEFALKHSFIPHHCTTNDFIKIVVYETTAVTWFFLIEIYMLIRGFTSCALIHPLTVLYRLTHHKWKSKCYSCLTTLYQLSLSQMCWKEASYGIFFYLSNDTYAAYFILCTYVKPEG